MKKLGLKNIINKSSEIEFSSVSQTFIDNLPCMNKDIIMKEFNSQKNVIDEHLYILKLTRNKVHAEKMEKFAKMLLRKKYNGLDSNIKIFGDKNSTFVWLYSKKSLYLLNKHKTWAIDGTFKICPYDGLIKLYNQVKLKLFKINI